MKKFVFDGEYFDIKSTLECGQVFRFKPYKNGYLVFSGSECCYAYGCCGKTCLESENLDYFINYFDLNCDYSKYFDAAVNQKTEILSTAAGLGKGIRILNQDVEETLFSFIISQNNHIPRIKSIIERICENLGEVHGFDGITYHAFPKATVLANKNKEFYSTLGLGYRDEYIVKTANALLNGFSLENLQNLSTAELKKSLLTLKGVGPKVADCVTLFGFHRFDSFPVDTWLYKVYVENFNGELKDRKSVADYFLNRFKDNSGIFQQYLFYYKRSLEEK